jgi:hypothetical protein
MKIDCIAFVKVTGETLLTLAPGHPMGALAEHVKALEKKHDVKVYTLRSFADTTGKEVAVEIITPLAFGLEDGTSPCARVEYWRRLTYGRPYPHHELGERISKAGFKLAGVLITPEEQAVRHAYDYLDNPFHRWNPGPVESYSPHLGDVLVVTSPTRSEPEAFVVEGIGFQRIIFSD